jgi:membrane-associated phospholipid phosphatase
MAISFIYVSRHNILVLIVSIPVNLAMLASAPPMGGHYLTDVIGGVAVAILSILATRWIVKEPTEQIPSVLIESPAHMASD